MGTKSDTCGNRTPVKKLGNHWSEGLLKAIKNPELIIHEDELTTVIKDLYPKSKFHYLVCPKENIPTLKAIKTEHLDLLKHMHKVGEMISSKHKDSQFLIGYHSVPSMLQLHLHVISNDFDSPCLKTKKHWNSFTTDFFIPSEKLIGELEANGKIQYRSISESNSFIKQSLKCHKCNYKPKHMPDLKSHIKTHVNE